MTIRNWCGAMMAAGFLVVGGYAAWADDAAAVAAEVAAPAVEEVSVAGKIVDLHCWASDAPHVEGKSEAECVTACLAAGSPAALITADGPMLLISVGEGAPKLADFAAQDVTARGQLHEKAGIKVLKVTAVEAVAAAPAEEPTK